jgi:hypothetical protein
LCYFNTLKLNDSKTFILEISGYSVRKLTEKVEKQ